MIAEEYPKIVWQALTPNIQALFLKE